MMQQSQKKSVIYVSTFVLCLFVGFIGTKLMKPDAISEPVVTPDVLPTHSELIEPIRQDFSFANSFVRRETHKGKRHGLKSDTILDVTYETRYTGYTLNGDTVEKHSETKEISRKVIRINKEEQKTIVEKVMPVLPRLTAGQFQSLLNNTSDNILEGVGSEDVSGAVRISVRNQKEGGKNVRNVRDVREKLETGHWRSARVISLGHDEQTGKITSAVIEPIYP